MVDSVQIVFLRLGRHETAPLPQRFVHTVSSHVGAA